MTITVAKLKRALNEMKAKGDNDLRESVAIDAFLRSRALTILAEKLSERRAPLVMDHRTGVVTINYIARRDCPTQLGDACRQGQRCCQRNPEWIASGEPDTITPLPDVSDDDYQRRASGT